MCDSSMDQINSIIKEESVLKDKKCSIISTSITKVEVWVSSIVMKDYNLEAISIKNHDYER